MEHTKAHIAIDGERRDRETQLFRDVIGDVQLVVGIIVVDLMMS